MRRNCLSSLCFVFGIAFLCLILSGKSGADSFEMELSRDGSNQVLLKTGRVTPNDGDFQSGLDYLHLHADRPSVHLMIQFREIPDPSAREVLHSQGIDLLQYIPNKTWLASVSTDLKQETLQATGARWLAPLAYEHKISHRILNESDNESDAPWAAANDGRIVYVVEMYKDVTSERGHELLGKYTTLFNGPLRTLNVYLAVLHPSGIKFLASQDDVLSISLRPPDFSSLNDGVREALDVNPLHAPPFDLDGSGVDILVYDTGLIDNHPDFGSRVVWGEAGAIGAHATHMAGTIAGDGANSGGFLRGMAPAAGLISYIYEACDPYCLYNSPLDIEDNYHEAIWTHGADLANNSIGSHIAQNGYPCDWEGDYELTARVIDAISCGGLGIPFLSVWAAGNERSDGRCGTAYGTMGIPATAKNVITVGSTMSNDHSMTWFSSWGPVDDGRIRPDICAPGCQSGGDGGVTSTLPGGGYESWCGTSMSPPSVSGILALVIQQLRQTTGDPDYHPLPSTLKALLINTAQDEGPDGPDFQFGFGEVRAAAAIDLIRNGYALEEGSLEQGGVDVYQFHIGRDSGGIKITVAWSDPPGTQLAEIALINDLDIILMSPGGVYHYPWLLDHTQPELPAVYGEDHLNPVEQVFVNDPEEGLWTLYVTGAGVPEGPQIYSLAANLPLLNGPAAVENSMGGSPRDDALNYPNPFYHSTTIRYRVHEPGGGARINIRDIQGRSIRTLIDERSSPGHHRISWDGCDDDERKMPAGFYFYNVNSLNETGHATGKGRMLLVR